MGLRSERRLKRLEREKAKKYPPKIDRIVVHDVVNGQNDNTFHFFGPDGSEPQTLPEGYVLISKRDGERIYGSRLAL